MMREANDYNCLYIYIYIYIYCVEWQKYCTIMITIKPTYILEIIHNLKWLLQLYGSVP